MNNYLVMTPGPTPIRKNVREAMMQPITNPDLDPDYVLFSVNASDTDNGYILDDTAKTGAGVSATLLQRCASNSHY